jgi:Uri superfamily endonuclease
VVAYVVAVVALVVQLVAVRPRLAKRSDAVLTGGSSDQRSSTHLYYVAFELVKAPALLVAGILLLAH